MSSRSWRSRAMSVSWPTTCSRRCGFKTDVRLETDVGRGFSPGARRPSRAGLHGGCVRSSRVPSERGQVIALARAFLGRFFDNELTAGSTDLKHSFFWLIAAAAMPGIAMPNANLERWGRLAAIRGPEGGPEFL